MRAARITLITLLGLCGACTSGTSPATTVAPTSTTTSTTTAPPPTSIASSPTVETGVWRAMSAGPLSARDGAHAFWVGSEMLVMGGSNAPHCSPFYADCFVNRPGLQDGAAFDPATNEWREIASSPVPLGRTSGLVHQGVVYLWVHGSAGLDTTRAFLAYHPGPDRWERLPMPESAADGELASTGDRLILYQWSQENGVSPDLLFDPQTQEWSQLPEDPLQPSWDRTMVWTGTELVLLGMEDVPQPGSEQPAFYRAAAYDFGTESWRRLSDSTEVIALGSLTWYWVDGRIINPSLGGADGGVVNNYGRVYPFGGVLNPASGEWLPLPDPPGYSAGLIGYTAAGPGLFLNYRGWIFEPATDRWFPVDAPPNGSCFPCLGSAVAWAESDLIVWGGTVVSEGEAELISSGWMWRPDR